MYTGQKCSNHLVDFPGIRPDSMTFQDRYAACDKDVVVCIIKPLTTQYNNRHLLLFCCDSNIHKRYISHSIKKNTPTYDEYLLESFVDEYERDECYEDFLHESREISHKKCPLQHDNKYRKHPNPHTDPQTKHQKLHPQLITHLHRQHA